VLCTSNDRFPGQVSSRLGVAAPAVEVSDASDLYAVAAGDETRGPLDFIVCDEVQFYAPHHADRLADAVDDLALDVHAFGLLADFRGRLFPASIRFLELADERRELQLESLCWCGTRATHTARFIDGTRVWDGDAFAVGDLDGSAGVTYELLCREHWRKGA
jgi:thymidine kinase